MVEFVPVDYDPFAAEKFVPQGAADWTKQAAQKDVATLSGIGSDLASLPQRAIESAGRFGQTGEYDPGPILEAAALPMGTGAIAGVSTQAGEKVLGSGLTARNAFGKSAREAAENFGFDSLIQNIKFRTAAAKAREPIDSVRDARIAGGYTTPAFRGMKFFERNEANPVHTEGGGESNLYSTESIQLADMYASYLAKHPGWKVSSEAFDEGAAVAPLWIDISKYLHVDAVGAHWSEFNWKAIQQAKDEGRMGVAIKNVWDEPGSTKNLSSGKTVYITFPEGLSTVKSKFATKFDKDSPNMLRGAIGIGGPAGYVATSSSDDQGLSFKPIDHDPFGEP